MTTPQPPADQPPAHRPDDVPQPALLSPLLPDDPARVGGFWLDARLTASPSGVAFTAHDVDDTPVMLVLLSDGAAGDAAARDRFAGTVNTMHIDTVVARGGQGQDEGRLGHRFRTGIDDPEREPHAPWVALAHDGTVRAVAEADRILAEVDLSWLPLKGRPSGPDYRLHWIDRAGAGVTRWWPLPWPGRYDRAGWGSILISWLLMMLMMALAVLLAILLFQGAPPQEPPPPVPTSASSPDSASPSPDSASPSPDSASPSPQSGSPGPSPSEASAGGSPSPNSKL